MNKYTGSNFDDFLEEEGILEEVSAKAHKRLIALQLADVMEESKISKTHLALTEEEFKKRGVKTFVAYW